MEHSSKSRDSVNGGLKESSFRLVKKMFHVKHRLDVLEYAPNATGDK